MEEVAAAGYENEDDMCPLCRAQKDSKEHRVAKCQHPDVVAIRNAYLNRQEQQYLDANFAMLQFSRGVVLHPDATYAPVQGQKYVAYDTHGDDIADIEAFDMSNVYVVSTDGSSDNHVIPDLARAAAAVVLYDAFFNKIAMVGFTLPSDHPHTAFHAEHAAAASAAKSVKQQWLHLTDNMAVVCTSRLQVRAQLDKRSASAGWRRQALRGDGIHHLQACEHVKAHQDLEAIEDPDELQCALANRDADELAVWSRKELHKKADSQVQETLETQLRFQKKYLRMLGELLALYPKAEKSERIALGPRPKVSKQRNMHHHSWTKLQFTSSYHHWVCNQCMRSS
jgi:hypothetical protein